MTTTTITTAARRMAHADGATRDRGTQLGFDGEGHLVEVIPAGMWPTTGSRYDLADYWAAAGHVTQRHAQAIIAATDAAREAGLKGQAIDEYVAHELRAAEDLS